MYWHSLSGRKCHKKMPEEFHMLGYPGRCIEKYGTKWPFGRFKLPFCAILFYASPRITKACETCLLSSVDAGEVPLAKNSLTSTHFLFQNSISIILLSYLQWPLPLSLHPIAGVLVHTYNTNMLHTEKGKTHHCITDQQSTPWWP